MDIVVLLILFINIVPVFGLLIASKALPEYKLSKSIVDPLFFYAVVIALHSIAFVNRIGEEVFYHPRYELHYNYWDLLQTVLIFTLCNIALVAGILTSLLSNAKSFENAKSINLNVFFSKFIFIVCCVSVALGLAYITSASNLNGLFEMTANRFVYFSENKFIVYSVSLLVVSFAFVLASVDKQFIAFLLLILTSLLLVFMGSRGSVLLALMIFLSWYEVRYIKIDRRYLMPALLLGFVVFDFLGYLTREASYFGSYVEYVNYYGGWSSVFTGGNAFVSPQNMLVLIAENVYGKIERIPGETFLLILLFPIPKAIVSFKPTPVNIDYTKYISPDVWADNLSQVTLGVFGEMTLEFGLVGGVVILFLIGLLYGFLTRLTITFKSTMLVITVPFLAFSFWHMYRTGIAQVAQIIWPWLIMWVVHKYLINRKKPNK